MSRLRKEGIEGGQEGGGDRCQGEGQEGIWYGWEKEVALEGKSTENWLGMSDIKAETSEGIFWRLSHGSSTVAYI